MKAAIISKWTRVEKWINKSEEMYAPLGPAKVVEESK